MATPSIPHVNVQDANLRLILQAMKERIEKLDALVQALLAKNT